MAAAKSSGAGKGWRPREREGGAARSASTSTHTAPGMCPPAWAAAPERPSRYQRTSAMTAPGRSRSQPESTIGGIMGTGYLWRPDPWGDLPGLRPRDRLIARVPVR